MVVCTFDNLCDKITRNKISHVRIVDCKPDSDGKVPGMSFDRFNDSSVPGLLKKLEKFATDYPKTFTAVLSKNQGGRESKMIFVIDFSTFTEPDTESHSLNGQQEKESDIESRIYARLKAEQETKEKEKEVQELRDELTEMRSGSGKLNYFIMQFIEGYMQKNPGQSMQGHPDEAPPEPHNQNNSDNLTELEKAFSNILRLFGEEDVIKMSNKLTKEPNLVQLLKSQI